MPAGNDTTNLIRFIRMDIGDDGTPTTYTDTQLVTMIAKSTIRVDADLAFGLSVPQSGGLVEYEQSISGSTFLASGTFLKPAGVSSGGLPAPLFNLVLLKTECLIAKRTHFDAAGKAIRVRDGDTEIDTSVGFGGLKDLTEGKGGPCAAYENSLEEYLKWFNAQEGDLTDFAAIVWKGSTRKSASHVEVGIDGEQKTEVIADFSDYLDSPGYSAPPAQTEPNYRLGPDRNA